MRMFIEASAGGIPRPDLCRTAAKEAIGFLEQIASRRLVLQSPAWCIEEPKGNPLVHSMWKAARLVGDPDLTPMVAVAGTIADATADLLAYFGMTRIVVNNGGDVAIRLKTGESVAVGVRREVGNNEISHRLLVTPEMNVGGICTSGLGGRSFTRGVASAATVLAHRAAISDAAATAIANATFVESPAVQRVMAEELDPDTDLKGLEITASVGELTDSEVEIALFQGTRRAAQLVRKGLIAGACITVKDRMRCTNEIFNLLTPLKISTKPV